MRSRIAALATAGALTLGGGVLAGSGPASAGPTGPCPSVGEFALELPSPNYSGYVLTDVVFAWDGVSTKANGGCDGPISSLRTRNTSNQTAWAMLPDKKKAPLWVQIDTGTDVTITAKGTLNNLGLVNASDAIAVTIKFVNPA